MGRVQTVLAHGARAVCWALGVSTALFVDVGGFEAVFLGFEGDAVPVAEFGAGELLWGDPDGGVAWEDAFGFGFFRGGAFEVPGEDAAGDDFLAGEGAFGAGPEEGDAAFEGGFGGLPLELFPEFAADAGFGRFPGLAFAAEAGELAGGGEGPSGAAFEEIASGGIAEDGAAEGGPIGGLAGSGHGHAIMVPE